MSARKGVSAKHYYAGTKLLAISDERWANITGFIPDTGKAAQLREPILECCSAYLTKRSIVERDAATAAAVRRPGKRQLAHLEQMADSLRKASDAWAKIDQKLYDDRLSEIRRFDGLAALALDAERRLKGIVSLGRPVALENPWPEFVRDVAECCRRVGLRPTASGAAYDERPKPSWFQQFVVAIHDNLLGDQGGRRHSKAARYAEIARALRVTRTWAKP